MRQVLVVTEEGQSHVHGALPRVGEVPSILQGVHRHVCKQQMHDEIVDGDGSARQLGIKEYKIEQHGD